MRYGKVVNGQIVNWIEINPGDTLKISKATASGYLPMVDGGRPDYNKDTQKLVVSGYTIEQNSITQNWEAVALPGEQIQANVIARAHKNRESSRKIRMKYALNRGQTIKVIKEIGGL